MKRKLFLIFSIVFIFTLIIPVSASAEEPEEPYSLKSSKKWDYMPNEIVVYSNSKYLTEAQCHYVARDLKNFCELEHGKGDVRGTYIADCNVHINDLVINNEQYIRVTLCTRFVRDGIKDDFEGHILFAIKLKNSKINNKEEGAISYDLFDYEPFPVDPVELVENSATIIEEANKRAVADDYDPKYDTSMFSDDEEEGDDNDEELIEESFSKSEDAQAGIMTGTSDSNSTNIKNTKEEIVTDAEDTQVDGSLQNDFENNCDDNFSDENLPSALDARASWSYNKSKAVRYALKHSLDEPQYSEDNGMGSDCANFVSKCINAGGIKTDSEWYPADGNNWGSDNWIRTGFYNNGGVVPYMTKKRYFKKTSSKGKVVKGNILYWTERSHVALVTDKKGKYIYYSQHSNKKLPANDCKNVLYRKSNGNVDFYIPTK